MFRISQANVSDHVTFRIMVSDIRKAVRICYDALPYHTGTFVFRTHPSITLTLFYCY